MHGETASTGPTTTNCSQRDPAVTEQIASHREFIALDLETTGLSARTDRIVEIGAIRFRENGDEVARYQSLVNPERPMPPSAYAIHGLSDEQLADARVAREVLPEFLEFLGNPGADGASGASRVVRRWVPRLGIESSRHGVTRTFPGGYAGAGPPPSARAPESSARFPHHALRA